MPEQLSKHPEVTLEVLRSAGAACGTGGPQEILKACPAERFCKLPGGEICVYGLPQATQMTQITPAEWRAVTASPPASAPTAPPEAPPPALPVLPLALALLAGLVIGLVLGSRAFRGRKP